MAGPTPPPAGVSVLTSSGGRIPVPDDEAAYVPPEQHKDRAPRNGRRVLTGEDALQDLSRFKVVAGEEATAVGVNGVQSNVLEGDMPASRRPKRHTIQFKSVDGNVYSFRTHDNRGKAFPLRNQMCLFLSVIEMQKGGSAFTVLDAYGVKFPSLSGPQAYPVPADIMAALGGTVVPHAVEEEEEDDGGFSLGD